jgi:hypothetical protein
MLGLQEMITIDDMERRSINTKNICNVRFACKASREYSGRLPSPLTSSNSFSRAMSSFQMWVPDGHSATSCRHEPYAQYAMHPILETTSSSTSMSMFSTAVDPPGNGISAGLSSEDGLCKPCADASSETETPLLLLLGCVHSVQW